MSLYLNSTLLSGEGFNKSNETLVSCQTKVKGEQKLTDNNYRISFEW